MKNIYLIRHLALFVEIDNYFDRDNVLWEKYNKNIINVEYMECDIYND